MMTPAQDDFNISDMKANRQRQLQNQNIGMISSE